MLELLSISFMCAVVAFVYAEIITRPGEVLAVVGRWLRDLLYKVEVVNGREVVSEHWLYKPLIGCSKCVAGQMALWSYLIWSFHHGYHAGHHVFVICMAILMTLCIKSFFNKYIL